MDCRVCMFRLSRIKERNSFEPCSQIFDSDHFTLQQVFLVLQDDRDQRVRKELKENQVILFCHFIIRTPKEQP